MRIQPILQHKNDFQQTRINLHLERSLEDKRLAHLKLKLEEKIQSAPTRKYPERAIA